MRKNNFDILRLLCAVFVIVSHSYALLGLNDNELLHRLTNNILWSDLGLCGFFTISGYLIYKSLIESKNIWSYLGKRILRIFPGLLVCLILVVLACSFVYSGEGNYWNQKESYTFVLNNFLLYPIQGDISGVFESNPISTVNGSLWTLPYEFTMYIILILLLLLRNNQVKKVLVAIGICALILKNTMFVNNFSNTDMFYINVGSFSRFAQYFAVGVLLQMISISCWSKKIKTTISIVSTLLSVGFIVFQITSLAMLCLSILFILFGEMCCEKIYNFIHKIGDLSYGTYIYAFPISQILILLFNLKISPTILTMLTLLFVLPIAYLSWRFVEKPALALKKYL